MTIIKQDSNSTGLSIAEELSLGVLPGSPIWYAMEPNSYPDFGLDTVTTARNPINASRQQQKGSVTDQNATGGFNTDVTPSNLQRLLQGFFFADAHIAPNTQPIVGSAVAVTGVTGATKTFAVPSGGAAFIAGMLAMFSGFSNAANNGLDKLAAGSGTTIVRTTGTIDEGAPPAAAKVEVVGFEFPTADVSLTLVNGLQRLAATATNLTTLGLNVGQWVFIGGDTAGSQFGAAVGFARIKTIAATYLEFDDVTFTPAAVSGAGKTIRIFFGTFIRNELNPSLIKRRSYQLERQMGDDGNGIQSEIVTGAIANDFKLNIPSTNKMQADISFIPTDGEYRTGTDGLKGGTRIPAPGESAYNTSSDVYRLKINVLDSTTSNPTGLFGYVTDANLSINNGASPIKAVGKIGAVEVSTGDFKVSGSITALFTTLAATQAIKNNADVGFNAIFTKKNNGCVYDVPLLTVGGGKANVTKDKEITVPVTQMGAQNAAGYTASVTFFNYLPDVAN